MNSAHEMARFIYRSGRPLADIRGIILDLSQAGFRAIDIHRHLDQAITKVRVMQRLA
jgi:hypothetical protein